MRLSITGLDPQPRFKVYNCKMNPLCPKTKTPGKHVKTVTVKSLVHQHVRATIEGKHWAFCHEPECDVVYFASDGSELSRADISVRIGVKEAEPPHTVCYCFGHTEESIRAEVARAGESTVVESVTARVKAGECSCEMMNPKGSCCLGDLRRAVRGAAS